MPANRAATADLADGVVREIVHGVVIITLEVDIQGDSAFHRLIKRLKS